MVVSVSDPELVWKNAAALGKLDISLAWAVTLSPLTPKPDLRDRSTLLASFCRCRPSAVVTLELCSELPWVRLKAAGGRVVREEVG